MQSVWSVHAPPQPVPLHTYGLHVWVCVAGHVGPVPGHFARSVATPPVQLAARHVSVVGAYPSTGQSLPPLQFSATSQFPFCTRHTVELGFFTSAGHVNDAPVQTSSASQNPTAARHTVPAFPAGCAHTPLLHTSSEQTFVSAVQPVPLLLKTSVGQVVDVPLHVSATSHSPAAARHSVPAFPAGCVHAPPEHTSDVQGLPSVRHAVPVALYASKGHVSAVPSQVSATSHSFTAGRHVCALPNFVSPGQVVELPSHFSSE